MQSEIPDDVMETAKAVVERMPTHAFKGDCVADVAKAIMAHAALSAAEPSEPKAYMHPCGAIWRADNYPAGMDFTADGWVALYDTPAPSVAVKALEWHRRITSWGHLLVAYDPFSRQAYGIRVEDNTTEENISRSKAEKQADYDARIRSALTAQVQDVVDIRRDALEEAAIVAETFKRKKIGRDISKATFDPCGRWEGGEIYEDGKEKDIIAARIRNLAAAPAKQEGKP